MKVKKAKKGKMEKTCKAKRQKKAKWKKGKKIKKAKCQKMAKTKKTIYIHTHLRPTFSASLSCFVGSVFMWPQSASLAVATCDPKSDTRTFSSYARWVTSASTSPGSWILRMRVNPTPWTRKNSKPSTLNPEL